MLTKAQLGAVEKALPSLALGFGVTEGAVRNHAAGLHLPEHTRYSPLVPLRVTLELSHPRRATDR